MPDHLEELGVGVAIRKEDGARALVLVVNGTPYLMDYQGIAAMAACVEEGVEILDSIGTQPGRPV